MWESRRDFEKIWEAREVGFYGFLCFLDSVISMACILLKSSWSGVPDRRLSRSPLRITSRMPT